MKFSHKYILPIFHYLVFILLGFTVMTVAEYLVPALYELLAYLFPGVFKVYSKIREPELYREMAKCLTVVAVSVTLLVVNYIALRVDNKRFEHMITLTDGLYTMSEGLQFYAKKFLVLDIIVALLIPPIVMIPFEFVPASFFARWLSLPFWCYDCLSGYFDIAEATVLLSVISLISRIVVIYPTVKVWRAMWITASVE